MLRLRCLPLLRCFASYRINAACHKMFQLSGLYALMLICAGCAHNAEQYKLKDLPDDLPVTEVAVVEAISPTNDIKIEYIEFKAEAQAPAWHTHFSPELAYYNKTNGNVNGRSGPSVGHARIATFKPNQGGYISGCSDDFKWCYLRMGNKKPWGWVKMEFMSAKAM